MIAWLKLTGTRRDTGDYSHLHLRLRRDCLLEFHRPSGQFPLAPAHRILREMPQAPEWPASPDRSPLYSESFLGSAGVSPALSANHRKSNSPPGRRRCDEAHSCGLLGLRKLYCGAEYRQGLRGQRAYPNGSIAAATADAQVDDPAGGNCRASGDAAAGEGPAAAVHCGAARYSCYRVLLRRRRHAASGHGPRIPD